MSETITPEAQEVLTMTEIEKRFDGEWVVLEDPYLNERKQVGGGTLRFHSKNRDEASEEAIRMRLKHGAFLYIGEMEGEIAINL